MLCDYRNLFVKKRRSDTNTVIPVTLTDWPIGKCHRVRFWTPWSFPCRKLRRILDFPTHANIRFLGENIKEKKKKERF